MRGSWKVPLSYYPVAYTYFHEVDKAGNGLDKNFTSLNHVNLPFRTVALIVVPQTQCLQLTKGLVGSDDEDVYITPLAGQHAISFE